MTQKHVNYLIYESQNFYFDLIDSEWSKIDVEMHLPYYNSKYRNLKDYTR